jgi:Flp pilus assembly secretin CpaC
VPPVQVRGGDAPLTGGSRVFGNPGGSAASALNPEASIFFGITREAGAFFGYLEALQDKGVVKVLATPTLVTLSGRPAEFLAGGEQPFPTAQGAVQNPSVEFKKFGTRLNFLPVVLGQGMIRLELVPEVSTVNFGAAINVGGIVVPQIVTQKLHATVEMQDGETLILGGIIQTEKDSRVVSVPVLGDIPAIGALFRRVKDLNRETELLVMVTPRLVTPLADKPATYPGMETRNPTDCELYLGGNLEMPLDAGRSRLELMPAPIDTDQDYYFYDQVTPLHIPESSGGPALAPPSQGDPAFDTDPGNGAPAFPGSDPSNRLQPVVPMPGWDPDQPGVEPASYPGISQSRPVRSAGQPGVVRFSPQ